LVACATTSARPGDTICARACRFRGRPFVVPSSAGTPRSHECLAADEGERFLDAVMVRLGERPLLDYLRLNIVARRR
jgi:hypothetical protein